MSSKGILLGFEVGAGEPVYILPHHLAIFGMTQLSGKTTTLEALVVRSGVKAVAFITKRGETGFTSCNRIPAFYRERVDWRYVESLLNTALGEKVKYEPRMRYAIMKVTKGPQTLREVRKYAVRLRDESRREWDIEVYSKLIAYLDLVLPELEQHTFATSVELEEGVNVMDISDMKLETQQLIIGSTIQYVYEHFSSVVVVIPEAWENLPQSRMTPVKWVAEQFVRKGAAIENYLWLDSQDIGGIDKTPLRQVSTWIMGRMMEAHEVERILKQLLGVKIPAQEIQTLPLGHFYVTVGNGVKKVYVLPAGIHESYGVEVATGKRDPETVKVMLESMRKQREEEELADLDLIKLDELEKRVEAQSRRMDKFSTDFTLHLQKLDEEVSGLKAQIQEIYTRLNGVGFVQSKETINLEHKDLTINIQDRGEEIVSMNTTTIVGKVLFCAVKKWLQTGWSESQLSQALLEYGWNIGHSSLAPTLGGLVKEGKLIKVGGRPTTYRLPTHVKFNIEKVEA